MLFTGVGHVQCVAAAVRAVAHPAPAALALVRTLDRWGPRGRGGGGHLGPWPSPGRPTHPHQENFPQEKGNY